MNHNRRQEFLFHILQVPVSNRNLYKKVELELEDCKKDCDKSEALFFYQQIQVVNTYEDFKLFSPHLYAQYNCQKLFQGDHSCK